jgi:hypothetical protein
MQERRRSPRIVPRGTAIARLTVARPVRVLELSRTGCLLSSPPLASAPTWCRPT